jgi:hypothetical protein
MISMLRALEVSDGAGGGSGTHACNLAPQAMIVKPVDVNSLRAFLAVTGEALGD